MAVSQKIVSANSQPQGGRIVTGVSGARGLTSSELLDTNHTQSPEPQSPDNIDQPIARIDAVLDTRYDDPTYYG